jgi:hypothetical protein
LQLRGSAPIAACIDGDGCRPEPHAADDDDCPFGLLRRQFNDFPPDTTAAGAT